MKTCLNVPKTCNGVPVESYLKYVVLHSSGPFLLSAATEADGDSSGHGKGSNSCCSWTATVSTFSLDNFGVVDNSSVVGLLSQSVFCITQRPPTSY